MALPETHQTGRELHPYVPRLAIEWLQQRPDERHHAIDGTLAFVDISGFTKLTERLSAAGRVGAEELSDILDSTFGALLAAARADGADLVKWGGDAVLLLFRGRDHASHAARASYRMRQVLRTAGRTRASVGQVTLRMSVGIHSGRFHFFLVGDPDIHRELVISGAGASVTARMEAAASAGQIAVSDATAALLREGILGPAVLGGRLLRSAPVVPDLPPVDGATVGAPDVAGLLPPPVRAHLLAATGTSEHRPVAVAFVQFSETDAVLAEAGAAAAADALDECVRNVQEACAAHGTSFLESDINQDGGKFMLAAGAPRSSGDDDDRLLHAMHRAVDRAGRLPLRAGVNHGRVFAGDFGPEFRRTFSLKGDAVNTAARVMAHAAWGEVLATEAVMARARTVFAVRPVPPFLVKGKSAPIRAVALGAPEDGRHDLGRDAADVFVGRDAELAAAADALDRARAGRGSLLDIIGEPGMGKSSLVREVLRRAGELRVFIAPSDTYEAKTPYYPFRAMLRSVLGAAPDDDAQAVATRLADRVRADAPHLEPWLPLLGVVLDVELPATRATDELEASFRQAKLQEVTVAFLALALPEPTVLVFENTHQMDDASAGLLRAVAAGIDVLPWLVLTTRREMPGGSAPAPDSDTVHPLRLEPITGSAALHLLDEASRTNPLSEHAMKAIEAKAGGNPLFLKALVAAAAHSGTTAELPDSVEAVLTSEIDRLEPDDRAVLRAAAVLGERFSETMLREILVDGANAAAEVDLVRLGELVQPDGTGYWRFRHALIRDVAYAGLPYRLRRRMHAHAGNVLEASATTLEEVSERLSIHYFHANDYARAWTYSRMAGRRAHAQYAYTAAAEFFERAIESGRTSHVAAHELAETWEELGDVRDVAGFSPDAVIAYRSARSARAGDPLGRATLMLKEAGLQQRLGTFVTSLRLLTHARGVLRDVRGPAAQATRSRLATRYAFGRYLQGDHPAALRWSETGVREARLSGDDDALAYAYNTRHLACIHAGVPEEEPYGELALASYESLGNLRMQGHCLNNLAISAMQEGRWNDSAALLERAADIMRRIGDTANEANTLYNRADLLIRQCRFAEAEPLLTAARRAARAAGDRELVALVARESGRVQTGLGRHDRAAGYFETARAGFDELGLTHELITLDEAVAEAMANAGDVDAAITVANRTLQRARELRVDSALASLHRVHGIALRMAGRSAEAAAAFQAGLRSPDGGDGRREYALNVLALAELDVTVPADEARSILAALGVVTPDALAGG